MPEQISGGMGFGGIRLNGQIIHYQGLHDVYAVHAIGTSDTITVGDQAEVRNLNTLHYELVTIEDKASWNSNASTFAEAIEVLTSEGTAYATTETVTFVDTATGP